MGQGTPISHLRANAGATKMVKKVSGLELRSSFFCDINYLISFQQVQYLVIKTKNKKNKIFLILPLCWSMFV